MPGRCAVATRSYSWRRGTLYEESSILSELPSCMRVDVAMFLHRDLIQSVRGCGLATTMLPRRLLTCVWLCVCVAVAVSLCVWACVRARRWNFSSRQSMMRSHRWCCDYSHCR